MHKLTVNLDHEVRTVQSGEVAKWAGSLVAACEAHIADGVFELGAIEALRQRLLVLKERARDIAFSMDFSFLFRPERRLLSIGYRVNANELDEACYDLLASEARLTSLFAIAKGDLPTEHWYKLGRPIVPIGARGALVSWSGSMFEYLMPPLVMRQRGTEKNPRDGAHADDRRIDRGEKDRVGDDEQDRAFTDSKPDDRQGNPRDSGDGLEKAEHRRQGLGNRAVQGNCKPQRYGDQIAQQITGRQSLQGRPDMNGF